MLPGVTGVVLAGGAGRRIGSAKATVSLAGRPLISYPLAALGGVCERAVVVCKADTALPDDVPERWDEPDDPRHPITGLVHALERAGGPILVCGADMPLLTAEVAALVAANLRPGTVAAVARSEGRLQPLLAAYAPEGLAVLRAAPLDDPLSRTVESLNPVLVDVPADAVFNVNTPDDLAEAERRLKLG